MSSYTVNNFSTKKYEGHNRDYFSWLEAVHNLLDAEGLKFTIAEAGGNGYIPCPHMADALVSRLSHERELDSWERWLGSFSTKANIIHVQLEFVKDKSYPFVYDHLFFL